MSKRLKTAKSTDSSSLEDSKWEEFLESLKPKESNIAALDHFAEVARKVLSASMLGSDEAGPLDQMNKASCSITGVALMSVVLLGSNSTRMDLHTELGLVGMDRNKIMNLMANFTTALKGFNKYDKYSAELALVAEILTDDEIDMKKGFLNDAKTLLPLNHIGAYNARLEGEMQILQKEVLEVWFSKRKNSQIDAAIAAITKSSGPVPQLLVAGSANLKEAWFQMPRTKKHNFSLKSGEQIETEFLMFKHKFAVAKCEELNVMAIFLPLRTEGLHLLLMKPHEGNDLDAMLKNVLNKPSFVSFLASKATHEPLIVTFPKFEMLRENSLMETFAKLELGDLLNEPDLTKIFESDLLPIRSAYEVVKVRFDEKGFNAPKTAWIGLSLGGGWPITNLGSSSPLETIDIDCPFAFVATIHKTFPMIAGRIDHPNP